MEAVSVEQGAVLDSWLASFRKKTVSTPLECDAISPTPENPQHLQVLTPSRSQRFSTARNEGCDAIFDGWLYNRGDLLAELGVPAKTANAALAIRAYLRWGEAALCKLRGIFALCIWNPETQTLLAARDPAGVYPLFYARGRHEWLFSSSIDALLQKPGVRQGVNRIALATYLLRNYRDIEETFFSEIRRIPPGHLLKMTPHGGHAKVVRYWNPLPVGEIDWISDADLEQFPRILKEAIGRCFQLGRVAIYLSGGLDSGTVGTLATDYARGMRLPSPHAISLVYEDPEANEERIQQGIASNLGIPQRLVRHEEIFGKQDLFSASLQLNCTWPHPLAVGLSPLHLMLGRQAKKEGCQVVLSGEGGDEWLALHYRIAADLIRSGDVTALALLWRSSKETAGDSWFGTTKRVVGSQGLSPLVRRSIQSLLMKLAPTVWKTRIRQGAERSIPLWLSPNSELRESLCSRAENTSAGDWTSLYSKDVTETILNQPLTVLYKEDNFECSRRTGVLLLEPFYDPEVIQFVARIPPWLRARGGRSKGLLRELLHRRHPHLGYDRQRKPYATGFVAKHVFEGAQRIWPELKRMLVLGELGVVDAARTDRLISEITANRDISQLRWLWMMLCAEIWVRSRTSC